MTNSINIKISKATFMAALGKVQSVVQNRNTIAILANVKLDVEKDEVCITATDMDIAISETVKCESKQDGTLTIDARKLYDIVRKMPDDEISIRGDAEATGKVQVKSKSCRFTLPCLQSTEFPIISRGNLDCSFNINTGEFLSAVNKTKFAMSLDEAKYTLNGVNLKQDDCNLISTATNAHKLGKVTTPLDVADFPNIILASKTVNIITKIFESSISELHIQLSKEKIVLTQGTMTLVSKLVDGAFPDTERVIPIDLTNELKINKQLFLSAIDRIALAADAKKNTIVISIQDGVMVVSAESDNAEQAEEDIDIETDINNFKIGFNHKYIAEVLHNIDSNDIVIYFGDASKPTVIKNPNADNELYLVMAVRI